MRYSEPKGLHEQMEQLRYKWPQAHYLRPKSGSKYDAHLIFLPGMILPKGWNKTICTAFFYARVNEPCLTHSHGTIGSPLDGFYVDLPDLRIAENNAMPYHARPFAMNDYVDFWHEPTQRYWSTKEELPGAPQWRELTRFWWRAQMFDPNRDTLFTSAMLVKQRLERIL